MAKSDKRTLKAEIVKLKAINRRMVAINKILIEELTRIHKNETALFNKLIKTV